MKWFKMLWLNSEERELLQEGKKKPEAYVPPLTTEQVDELLNPRPYKNVYYSNGNLTVVFKDGNVISKANVFPDIFYAVRDAKTVKEIEDLTIDRTAYSEPKKIKEIIETSEERKLVVDNLGILRGKADFVIKGTDVYLKGVNLAMPASIIGSFIEILEKLGALQYGDAEKPDLEEQLQALKMFWLKLALNPLEQSRQDLLVFVRKNDIRITRNGNLILYRRIVTKDGADTGFVTFVSQEYYRLKKAGEDTRAYALGKNVDGYYLFDLRNGVSEEEGSTLLTNLQQAYLELPNYESNTFTSAHDDRVEIKLGGIYQIPEDKINLDNGICAAGGLHAAAVDYDYSGFGDMPVVVLVNPSKAITVPMGETGKLRTIEMFVACVNDKPHGEHFDESALSAFDSEYHDLTLDELENAAKSKSFDKLSILDTVPAVSLVDLGVIRDMLKARVREVI